jgi:hypothetical protein
MEWPGGIKAIEEQEGARKRRGRMGTSDSEVRGWATMCISSRRSRSAPEQRSACEPGSAPRTATGQPRALARRSIATRRSTIELVYIIAS